MPLALSTAWNYARANNGREIVAEIKKLGFTEIELNFSLTQEIVAEISEIVRKGEITVTSVHNFCPIPQGLSPGIALPDCFSLASLDEAEREKAVYYTKKSVDTASELRAKAVVLHSGRNEIPDSTRDLIALCQKGYQGSEAFSQLKDKMRKGRQVVAGKHLAQALKSIAQLAGYAEKKQVALGIENRFYYREIPSVNEIGAILDEFKGSPVYYWHDAGHAKIFEILGLVKQNEYLDLYSQRMLGLHLHNVLNCVDHQSPSKGEIDFKGFIPYIRKENLKVIEAHSPLASAEDLSESKARLEKIFDGKI